MYQLKVQQTYQTDIEEINMPRVHEVLHRLAVKKDERVLHVGVYQTYEHNIRKTVIEIDSMDDDEAHWYDPQIWRSGTLEQQLLEAIKGQGNR